MSVLVATSDGYHIFTSSGKHLTALVGRALGSLAPGPDDTWVAVVDQHEVWQHAADGTWSALASADVDLSSLVTVAGVVFAGTYDARLLRLDAGRLVPVESFDHISNRGEWHQVGPALNVRSMTATCDDQVLLANVHVGGIQRSTDLGDTWEPTIEVDHDVHEVLAHPTLPNVVMAAAAVGLCVSDDAGATWSVVTDGLPTTYARAVAYLDDDVLLSISDGPRAAHSAIYRRPLAGGALERIDDGLGEELVGNVDTRCLATGKGRAALADGAGNVWLSDSGISGWQLIAKELPWVSGVAVA
jgi:hypothetical protein